MRVCKGQTVRVVIPVNDETAREVIKFNGFITKVSKVVSIRFETASDGSRVMRNKRYFELDYCVSMKNVPYGFVEDWLEVRDDEQCL